MKKLSLLLLFVLTSCATWNEDFEGKVVRAYPKASIHKINEMADKGILKDVEEDTSVSFKNMKVFKDGVISRGAEDIRRMCIMTYEDSAKNLHMAHNLYLVVSPATWIVDGANES